MGYEVDFFNVGDKSQPGAAIALRYGDLSGDRSQQTVMVIDGGTLETGDRLVEHIKKFYGTEEVDFVVLTHMHDDHASGLRPVLEQLQVNKLVMHRPWANNRAVLTFMQDGRATPGSVKERLVRSLSTAKELEDLATEKGIPIVEPFADVHAVATEPICVLGPDKAYFAECMAAALEDRQAPAEGGLLTAYLAAMGEGIRMLVDKWLMEALADPGENDVTPTNNASVILLIQTDERQLLFTGDAGVPALTRALDKAVEIGVPVVRPQLLQIPHHGSKRNLGPTLLDRLCGTKSLAEVGDGDLDRTAIACCAKESAPKHPHALVTNALRRRKYKGIAANTSIIHHRYNAPDREGWYPVNAIPFISEIEDD